MKLTFVLLLATVAVGQAKPVDVRVKAADAVAKDCPPGKHWEKGNYIAESPDCSKTVIGCGAGYGGTPEDYDYYHCVKDKKPPKVNSEAKASDPPIQALNGLTTDGNSRPDPDVSQAISDYKERLKAEGVTHEPMDVPAVKNGTGKMVLKPDHCYIGTEGAPAPFDGHENIPPCEYVKDLHYTCTDKRRILLTDESGGKHCILFPKESK